MKKLLLAIAIYVGASTSASAQCSSTSPAPFMNCNYYGDYISAFTLNNIASTGNTGCGTSGYNLFATPVRTLAMGQTYNWAATTGYYYSNGFGMWVDWNNDGQYGSNEIVAFRSYAYNHSGTLTVPYNAVVGTNLRMRIRCAQYYTFNATTSACSTLNGYGETEDYFLYISCPASLPSLTVSATNTNICLGQSVTFTASGVQSYTWVGGSTAVTNAVPFAPTSSASYTVTGGIPGCPSVTNSAVRVVSVATVPLPVTAVTNSATICSGQTATLTASGATSYTWLPTNLPNTVTIVSPTTATTYTLIGYNGSACPGTATVALNVNQSPTISIIATTTDVCVGSAVTLSVTGGVTYTWQQGGTNGSSAVFNPTIASLYIASGSNSGGCTSQAGQVITVKPAPSVSVTANRSTICVGAVVTLSASGATSYLWSNQGSAATTTASPTVATVYTVVGTAANGCTGQNTIAVGVYTHPMTVLGTTAICSGESTNISASAGAVSTYTWSNNTTGQGQSVSPVTTTTYVVAATTQTSGMSCKSSGTVVITVNPLPVILATATPSSVCRKEVSTIAATGAGNYQWSNAKTGASFTVSSNGSGPLNFIVTGSDNNGCVNTASVNLLINACNAISEEAANAGEMSVFPNPNKGVFTVHFLAVPSNASIKVYNSLGALIKEQACTSDTITIDIEKEAKGVYFVELVQNSKKLSTTRIIKE